MHSLASKVALILAVGGLAACSLTRGESDTPGKLAAARSALQKADGNGTFTGVARTDLDAARHYLQQAEAAKKKGDRQRDVDNLAYTAEQLATAAMARQESMRLQDKEARDRDAKMALHKAETAELEAERTRQLTEPVK
jgi:outer membrane lipopolysaccharide assembly protein LptE/RlpB